MAGGELDILKIILDSGLVVKGVLILLILASVASWGIIFFKKNMLSSFESNNIDFRHLFEGSKNLDEVYQGSHNLAFSPYREIFTQAYQEVSKFGTVGDREQKIEVAKRGMKKGENAANEEMDKSLSTLASIGSVSPFVGLFGTVWGIINSFSGLASGGGTLEAVAPGIAEALVATAVGLAAAIPAVWFFNHFNNSIARSNSQIDSFKQELLNSIEKSIS